MPQVVAMYADMLCPFAYLTAWRLRTLREKLAGTVVIAHKSLALEYINNMPSWKKTTDMLMPLLFLEDPDTPWRYWTRPDAEWPVTAWPAFEAVKCAERQNLELADELDWALRYGFFAEGRCIALRHEIIEIAGTVDGLDVAQFTVDYDSGVAKGLVIAEAREGWEQLNVNGSLTFVFPSGRQVSDLGLPRVRPVEGRVARLAPPPCSGQDCRDRLLEILTAELDA